jgi:hypothetical protein
MEYESPTSASSQHYLVPGAKAKSAAKRTVEQRSPATPNPSKRQTNLPQMPVLPIFPTTARSSSSVAPLLIATKTIPSDRPLTLAGNALNPVLLLNKACKSRDCKPFEVLEEEEVQGQRGFWRCTITACGRSATAEAEGKKAATKAAAEKLLSSMDQ